jgi:hypothetical protein
MGLGAGAGAGDTIARLTWINVLGGKEKSSTFYIPDLYQENANMS